MTDVVSWTEAGPHEVAPGLYRLPLPLPITGLVAVNAYLAAGPQGLVLVDPGWATEENERAVTRGLAELGYGLDDIAVTVATHHHGDHYSQGCTWSGTRGTPVLIGRGEAPSILDYSREAPVRFPVQVAQLREEGAHELADGIAGSGVPNVEGSTRMAAPDGWLDHGDRIDLADGALDVIATPGHTRGHIILRHTASGSLITGDHVLPRITPSIGFEWSPEDSPLSSFLASLDATLGLADGALLPAHGEVLPGTHERVRELIAHHEERLAEVRELLADGLDSAFAIAGSMRWTRRRLTLDELPVEHRMIAVGEIRAHLVVLVERGDATLTAEAGVRRYVPAVPGVGAPRPDRTRR
ncbi:MBL fold metallo-hydrolase [Tsukamurella paurometabola]|uniref:Beta-lactamase domain protein n=1 Tax=Tsukamurella paurometabola (strain ATCC 8368 / DSM 20162 / CCUG 35730 / CIP 100753 / JCM 10117 / KCTC 9821 / NBRC 16120 / NCIMB 702349 / NCTC 13040) TaxID=521096 RepID=D5UTR6_TSUPD|nr:MBL fold metallo-hydrolase [Tsukamurella paurometabola]ADG77420.1 beta-lactamase domain protein [Tsukamurella paurometabola DSM 20162]SUP26972.1 hydroxyacylglutathione hydrolase [Tsukamurella paurometabola]